MEPTIVKHRSRTISMKLALPVRLYVKIRAVSAAAGLRPEELVIDLLLDALAAELDRPDG